MGPVLFELLSKPFNGTRRSHFSIAERNLQWQRGEATFVIVPGGSFQISSAA